MIKVSDRVDDIVYNRRRTITVLGLKLPWPFPIASGVHGSSAVILGWPVYGAGAPKYIRALSRPIMRLSDAKYWVKVRVHPEYRHHVVKTGLKPGWYDCDTVMLHACMALLCRYVEWECGGHADIEKWNEELRQPGSEGEGPREIIDRQVSTQDEALAIYRWWKVQKPADVARRDALLHELFGNSRISWVETENPNLSQMVFREFEGDEVAMHEEFRALEERMDRDEQEMLHRLIDIRGGLWT